MLTTEIENGAWHCSLENRGSHFYHNPSLRHQINVGVSGKASDNMTLINIASGERGFFFFLEIRQSVSTIFSRIVDSIPYVNIPLCISYMLFNLSCLNHIVRQPIDYTSTYPHISTPKADKWSPSFSCKRITVAVNSHLTFCILNVIYQQSSRQSYVMHHCDVLSQNKHKVATFVIYCLKLYSNSSIIQA